MKDQRKQILENLAETLGKIDENGLRAVEIFTAGVAAGAAFTAEKKTEEKKEKTDEKNA